MSAPRAYRAFGLSFHSERELPELPPAPLPHEPSVRLSWADFAPVPSPRVEQGLFRAAPGVLELAVPGVARYRICRDEIVIHAEEAASPEAMRLFLLGSCIGALLHLNGILALHGSAVRTPDGSAALVTGVSTAGKSTLLAALTGRDLIPLCDDVAGIHFDEDGTPWVHPGLSRMKLWRDTLEMLGQPQGGALRVRPELDKYVMAMPVHSEAARVTRIYELCAVESGEVSMSEVKGVEKVRLLSRQTYRPAFVEALGLKPQHLTLLGRLAPRVQTKQLVRPRGRNTLPELIAQLEADWQ